MFLVIFASINFRELPFQEFSKAFTFAKRSKIRENRESFCSRKFVRLKYFKRKIFVHVSVLEEILLGKFAIICYTVESH